MGPPGLLDHRKVVMHGRPGKQEDRSKHCRGYARLTANAAALALIGMRGGVIVLLGMRGAMLVVRCPRIVGIGACMTMMRGMHGVVRCIGRGQADMTLNAAMRFGQHLGVGLDDGPQPQGHGEQNAQEAHG